MKNNKKFLYDLENIPDRFLDEAQGETVRKKKIRWYIPVSEAACIALMIAVPIMISHLNQKEKSIPLSSEAEITASLPETEAPHKEEPVTVNKTEEAFTEPLYIFYYINGGAEDTYAFQMKDGYFTLDCLKDKEFEEQINREIAELTDSITPYFKEEYMPETNADDANSWENCYETHGLVIKPQIINGYFSLILGYTSSHEPGFIDDLKFEHIVSLNYDLVEKKRMYNVNDILGNEKDPEELKRIYSERYSIDGEISDTLFTADEFIIKSDSDLFSLKFVDRAFALENNLSFTETRDFRDILDDRFVTEKATDSAANWGTDTVTFNGSELTYNTLEKSPLYPDSWCERHNRVKKYVMEDILKKYVENGIDPAYAYEYNWIISSQILGTEYPYYRNICFYAPADTALTVFDTEKNEKINISEIFTEEGLAYISDEADKNGLADRENFKNMFNSGELKFFFKPGIVKDQVYMELYTNEILAEINIPPEMMNSRYFDYEKYCETES